MGLFPVIGLTPSLVLFHNFHITYNFSIIMIFHYYQSSLWTLLWCWNPFGTCLYSPL
ncbi:uncharacterized protein DS421_6g180340 [Arachis hypogaea]|nr:uncharacterized protein DS421_6g180340 [Arachis hypogaea]